MENKDVLKNESMLSLIFVGIATSLFYEVQGPLEIIYFNTNSIPFGVKQMYLFCIVMGIISIVALTIILRNNRLHVCRVISSILLFITLGGYIQNTFLNGSLKSASGADLTFDLSIVLKNCLIWGILAAIIIFLHLKSTDNVLNRIKIYLSLALSGVFIVCILSVTVTTSNNRDDLYTDYFSTQDMFVLSSEKNNAIVFIVDSFDNRVFDKILRDYAQILDEYHDFTYYNNCVSTYSRTYPSVIHMLTGEYCFFDKEPEDWSNQAYEQSDVWDKLSSDEYNVFMCTEKMYVGEKGKAATSNYVKRCRYEIDKWKSFSKLFRMTLYRNAPYMIKKIFSYDMNMFGDDVLKYEDGYNSPIAFFDDDWFNSMLTKRSVTAVNNGQGYIKVYHLKSVHKDFTASGGIYSLQIIAEYIRQMRHAGVYDNTAIFIVADHGYSDPQGYDISGGNSPLLLVKNVGEKHEEYMINEAPVSHVDLIPSIEESIGIEKQKDDRSFWQIGEDEKRVRQYYKTVFFNDSDGEIDLRKYEVLGDAKEKASYSFTGDKWKIIFSENNVFNE